MTQNSDKIPKEEMDNLVQSMINERQRQDAEARKKIISSAPRFFNQCPEKPFSKEEVNKKIQDMIRLRQQQDADLISRCSHKL